MLMEIDRVILHRCKETRRIFTDIMAVKGARFNVQYSMFTVERMRRDDLKRSRWACAACERDRRRTFPYEEA